MVFCNAGGQLISPADKQLTIVYDSVVDTVVVTIVSRGCKTARGVTSAAAATAGVAGTEASVLLTAQMLASVVYHSGVVVLGAGPHWYVSMAMVAPAAAPTAMVYSATAASSQSSVDDPSTSMRKSATYANASASIPVLALSSVPWGVEASNPTWISSWSNASIDPWPAIVTGRNSNWAPGLDTLVFVTVI